MAQSNSRVKVCEEVAFYGTIKMSIIFQIFPMNFFRVKVIIIYKLGWALTMTKQII